MNKIITGKLKQTWSQMLCYYLNHSILYDISLELLSISQKSKYSQIVSLW